MGAGVRRLGSDEEGQPLSVESFIEALAAKDALAELQVWLLLTSSREEGPAPWQSQAAWSHWVSRMPALHKDSIPAGGRIASLSRAVLQCYSEQW